MASELLWILLCWLSALCDATTRNQFLNECKTRGAHRRNEAGGRAGMKNYVAGMKNGTVQTTSNQEGNSNGSKYLGTTDGLA